MKNLNWNITNNHKLLLLFNKYAQMIACFRLRFFIVKNELEKD